MYKVFIYNKPIYFIDTSDIKEKNIKEKTYSCEIEKDKKGILSIHRSSNSNNPLFVTNKNLDKLKKIFFGDHKKIEAAGGIVVNPEDKLLFIKRLGYWDLPKGKVEKNEELKKAAIREVEEECGITSPTIEKKIMKTYHTYNAKGRSYFKTTHWYLMKYNKGEMLTPQAEEGITEVVWVEKYKMDPQVSNTYNSIIDVLNKYLS
jgi:ADP-ribose pyrophosphatase YjhB (NUDIX family)